MVDRRSTTSFVWWVWMVVGLLATGCVSGNATIQTARQAFIAGDLDAAQVQYDELIARRGRDALPAQLDRAIVELAAGNPRAAETRLRQLRDQFDEADGAAPLHEVASMLTDDNARRFQPAPYEQVMIRTLLAVCSLAQDGDDAESYANQAAMKQAQWRQKAGQRMTDMGLGNDGSPAAPSGGPQELAFAPYLRGVLREATHHDFDDAQRNYRLVSAIAPSFRPAADDLARAQSGVHSPPGHGVVYIFSLVGRGPVLEPVEAPTTSAALSIASVVIGSQADRKDEVDRLPTVASVQIPGVVHPPSPIATVAVHWLMNSPISTTQKASQPAACHFFGTTQPLTDVGLLVDQQMEVEMPWIIARSVARRVSKEVAVSAARRSLGINGGAGTLFQFATTTAWTATEKVDTRCWGLLPREIQVLRAEMPVGQHSLRLEPVGWNGYPIGQPSYIPVTIHDARNTYLIVVAPDVVLHVVGPTAAADRT